MTYAISLDSDAGIAINGPWLVLKPDMQFQAAGRVLVTGRWVYRIGETHVVYGVGDVAFTVYEN